MEKYNDIAMWRGTRNCAWTRFIGTKPIVLWMYDSNDIIYLADREKEKKINLYDKVREVKRWENIRDLIKRIKNEKDVINVIYTVPKDVKDKFKQMWYDILDGLTKRIWKDSVTVGFDEYEDLAPLNASGKSNKLVGEVADIVKEMRKNDISIFGTTHRETLIDWRVLAKIRWSVYMRRAFVKPENAPRSFDFNRTDKLERGDAYIVNKNFEQASFDFEGNGKRWILVFENNEEE